MQLQRIEILGFRGIKRLSIGFDEITTLIGENTWGKSSLLDALSLALPSDGKLYQFVKQDFHVDYSASQPQSQQIQIITRWQTSYPGEDRNARYRNLKPIWLENLETDSPINRGKKGKIKNFIYQITAVRNEHKVSTAYQFLDADGDALSLHDSDKLALDISRLHPVIRLRDSRRLGPFKSEHLTESKHHASSHLSPETPLVASTNTAPQEKAENQATNAVNSKIEKRINNTYRRLLAMPGHVDKAELKSTLNAMQSLIEHYFSFQYYKKTPSRKQRERLFASHNYQVNNEQTSLTSLIHTSKNPQSKLLLMGLLNAYLQAKGDAQISQVARPILILEDPEGRLHPSNLLKAWELLQMIPMQKIVTTNSAVLLSAVPISAIRRLVRQSDKTLALAVSPTLLNGDELRRISFHIRFHRPNALFANCWLLVEGETEVWLFNEMAKMCGFNLAAEGVQLIEFAQSGLRPIIKVAKALHIDWHVVSDGDMAGKKYSDAVRSQLGTDKERHRLTELPDRDIEHFLYKNGFEMFFRDMIKVPKDSPLPPHKIITRVLKKHAKPDIALGIVRYCEERGVEHIPLLLRWIIKRVLTMARGNS